MKYADDIVLFVSVLKEIFYFRGKFTYDVTQIENSRT